VDKNLPVSWFRLAGPLGVPFLVLSSLHHASTDFRLSILLLLAVSTLHLIDDNILNRSWLCFDD